jgi:hypothetical protein
MNKVSSQDRRALIRLASEMPVGSQVRRAILAGLQKVSMEHASEKALKQYLKDHPNADPKKHTVKGDKDKGDDAKPPSKVKRPSEEDFDEAWDVLDEAFAPRKTKAAVTHLGEGGSLSVASLDNLSKALEGLEGDDKKKVEGIAKFVKAEKEKMEFISSVAGDMADSLPDISKRTLKDLAKGGQKMSVVDLEELIEDGDAQSKSWGPDEKKAWATVKAHAEAEAKWWKEQ